jgi:SnoaL-like domain
MRSATLRACVAAAFCLAALTSCAIDTAAVGPYQGKPDDFVQIYQLFAKYSYDINIGDGGAWASNFTPDGVFQDPSWCAIGRQALSAIPGHNPTAGQDLKHFHFSVPGPILYVDKDHATVHSTVWLMSETGAGKQGGVTLTGTYDDKLTRMGQWKFAYRFVQRPNKTPPIPCAPQAANGFKFTEWP